MRNRDKSRYYRRVGNLISNDNTPYSLNGFCIHIINAKLCASSSGLSHPFAVCFDICSCHSFLFFHTKHYTSYIYILVFPNRDYKNIQIKILKSALVATKALKPVYLVGAIFLLFSLEYEWYSWVFKVLGRCANEADSDDDMLRHDTHCRWFTSRITPVVRINSFYSIQQKINPAYRLKSQKFLNVPTHNPRGKQDIKTNMKLVYTLLIR